MGDDQNQEEGEGEGFPEEEGVLLDEGESGGCEVGVGVFEVVEEFGHGGVAGVGADGEGFFEGGIHPEGDHGVVGGDALVVEFEEAMEVVGGIPGWAEGEVAAGEEVVGEGGDGEEVGGGGGGGAEAVFGRGEVDGSEGCGLAEGGGNFGHAGDAATAVVDDFDGAVLVEEDVVGFEVLVEGFFAMKGADAGDELASDVDDAVDWRGGILGAPLGEGEALDEFHGVVEEAAGGGAADRFDEVRAFGAEADPFFEGESFEVGGVVGVGDGGGFENEGAVVVVGVVDEVELGVAGGGDHFFDGESIDGLAGEEVGREGEFAELAEDVVLVIAGEGVDAEDEAGAVVGAVAGEVAEILDGVVGVGVCEEGFANLGGGEGVVDAVGGEEEGVAGLDGEAVVVDARGDVETHGAGEVGGVGRDAGGVVAGDLLEFLAAKAVESAVADVEDVSDAGFEDEAGEGGDATFFGGGVSLSLGDEPAVEGGEDALAGGFDLPGFGGFVVVVEEAPDAGFGGFLTGGSGGDAIGDAGGDPFGGEEVVLRNVHPEEVFVLRFGAGVRELGAGDCEFAPVMHVGGCSGRGAQCRRGRSYGNGSN